MRIDFSTVGLRSHNFVVATQSRIKRHLYCTLLTATVASTRNKRNADVRPVENAFGGYPPLKQCKTI